MRLLSASDRALSSARTREDRLGSVDLDRLAGLTRPLGDVGDHLAHQGHRVEIDESVALRARFHSAEVEQRLDQALQPCRLARENPVVSVPAFVGRTRSCSSISAICRTVVRGERNSCDTAATKSDCSRADVRFAPERPGREIQRRQDERQRGPHHGERDPAAVACARFVR